MFTLLLGGARSGKTRLAERLAIASGDEVAYIATGEAGDQEMADRIARHQSERPEAWLTIEAPRDLDVAIGTASSDAFVIVDCLTLWLANRLEDTDAVVLADAARVALLLAERNGPAAVVSNEVGSGIIPMGAETRRYRELLGVVNSTFRGHAASSYLCVAGGVVPIGDLP